jgi:hypothetical protein
MKNRKTFSMRKWRENKDKSFAIRKKCIIFMLKHPLTWLVLMLIVVYGGAACGVDW